MIQPCAGRKHGQTTQEDGDVSQTQPGWVEGRGGWSSPAREG